MCQNYVSKFERILQQPPVLTITFEQSSGFRIVRIDIGNEKANEKKIVSLDEYRKAS